MESKLLDQWKKFKSETGDPQTAAILTLAMSLASGATRRTGLNMKEAADFLGIGETTLRELCSDGRLRPTRIGRAVRFNTEDLEAFQHRKTMPEKINPASDLRHFQRKKQRC